MSEDFGKLPDVVTPKWIDDLYKLPSSWLPNGGSSALATLINEARAADRQEITDLRAKLAAHEEREKRSAVEFDECVRLPVLEWPDGMNEYVVSGGFRKNSKAGYMTQDLRVINRPTYQPTPAQIRAEMLAKLDEEYQRIEAEMSRIEAMTDAEVLAHKDCE